MLVSVFGQKVEITIFVPQSSKQKYEEISKSVERVRGVKVTGDDILATVEEQAVTTNVADLLANDSDVDDSVVTFVSLGAVSHGGVVLDGSGNITFTPDNGYFGNDAGFHNKITGNSAYVFTTNDYQILQHAA